MKFWAIEISMIGFALDAGYCLMLIYDMLRFVLQKAIILIIFRYALKFSNKFLVADFVHNGIAQ